VRLKIVIWVKLENKCENSLVQLGEAKKLKRFKVMGMLNETNKIPGGKIQIKT